jgi:hypothetical protein
MTRKAKGVSSQIVKVQVALAGDPNVLIYNEDRSIQAQFPASKEVLTLMAGRVKAYFHSTLDENGLLGLDEEAPNQDW